MQTPIVKIKSRNDTPWRSPKGIASGKKTLDSFRKQKRQNFSPAPSSHQPYPRELAALLSSRIDRYKRICPNISNNLEEKIGLSPIALTFPSPKTSIEECKKYFTPHESLYTQSSFLESVLGDTGDSTTKDILSENKQIAELVISLSNKFRKDAFYSSDRNNTNEFVELCRNMELLGKKLEANLLQQSLQSVEHVDSKESAILEEKLQYNNEVDKLKVENENLRAKLSLYQKQMEAMSETHKEALPRDAGEAMQVLREKLHRSMRQVEEGKELASMLRTALASAIQDRINLEEIKSVAEKGSDQSVEETNHVNGPELIVEGEYDEVLAMEYTDLWNIHRQEAEKEKNCLMQASRSSDLETGTELCQHGVYTNDLLEIDSSKINSLTEEKFLSQRKCARISLNEKRAHGQDDTQVNPIVRDNLSHSRVSAEDTHTISLSDKPSSSINKPSFEERRAAAKKTTSSSAFSWIPGMSSQQPELHSAVLIF